MCVHIKINLKLPQNEIEIKMRERDDGYACIDVARKINVRARDTHANTRINNNSMRCIGEAKRAREIGVR
jgi:hypothetical protein